MEDEALGFGDRHARGRQGRRRVADPHLAHPPAEVPRAQPGGKARRAAGRQAMVGAGDVVAEGGRSREPHEHASGAAHARRKRLLSSADQLEVLGRELVGEREAGLHVGHVHERRHRLARIELDRIEERGFVAGGDHDRPRPVLRLRSEIERCDIWV